MSFNPDLDGSKIWTYMHLMAANATNQTKRDHYVYWLNSLKEVFPCEKCRIHLIQNLEKLPVEPYSKTNVSLFFHSWKLHDTVNGQLNKPISQRLTYEQAFSVYFPEKSVQRSAAPAPPAIYERHPVASSHHEVSPSQESVKCSSCQAPVIENENRTYTQFRQTERKKFSPKN